MADAKSKPRYSTKDTSGGEFGYSLREKSAARMVQGFSRRRQAPKNEGEKGIYLITRKIYDRQARNESTKGDILGHALDAADALKESDQRCSFDSFWNFYNYERC